MVVGNGGPGAQQENKREGNGGGWEEPMERTAADANRLGMREKRPGFLDAFPAAIPHSMEPMAGHGMQSRAYQEGNDEYNGPRGDDAVNAAKQNLHGGGIA